MKKLKNIMYMLICLMTINTFVFAQDSEKKTTPQDALTMTQNIEKLNIETLSKIGLLFCNNWLEENKMTPQLNMTARPWSTVDICSLFYSKSEIDANIIVWFSE